MRKFLIAYFGGVISIIGFTIATFQRQNELGVILLVSTVIFIALATILFAK